MSKISLLRFALFGAWNAMLAWYLVLVLALWPLMVAVVKCTDRGTWRDAQRQTWIRWNEIRLTCRAPGPLATSTK